MKKVLFVVSTLARNGPSQQLLNLCRFLPENGYRPSILTLSPEPADSMDREFEEHGIEHQTLNLSRRDGIFLARRRVREVIDSLTPDIIHTSGLRSDAVGHAVAGKIPHIMTIRNYAWEDYPAKFGRLRGGLMAIRHLRTIKHGACPVACSRTIADRLASVREMEAVANGVDTDRFRPPQSGEVEMLRKKLDLPLDRPIVLSVGALISRKQPDILLQAFLGAEAMQSAELVFVGSGPLRAELERQARGHPNIRFLGLVENVAEFLRCADLSVSTSRSEGLPNSVLESLASGVPVILSDIAPHLELGVEEVGAGMIAAVGDSEDLARKLDTILTGGLDTARGAARSRALEKYSARSTARQYAQLYERMG